MNSTPTNDADPIVDANEMVFTDDELKELKADLVRMPNIDVCNYFDTDREISALVARLEAAERVIKANYGEYGEGTEHESYAPSGELYMAWRKAAGK